MGKSQYMKALSIIVMVLGVAYVGIGFLNKPLKTQQVNLTLKEASQTHPNKVDVSRFFNQSSFEENRTLDIEYQSVAAQIKDFIKREKFKVSSMLEKNATKLDESTSKINTTVVIESQRKAIKLAKKRVEDKFQKETFNLPKLAIIMDDVGFYEEAQRIKEIPFAITPSIFPPNEYYPETARIAKKFKYHMVHLPMEAYKYKNIKEEAIKVSDKLEVIEDKIQNMQKNFPNAIAINNHTGSKYTCDFDAMEQFFSVLNRYDINFIDSRTSSGSQCQEVGKLLNKKVLQRDIFLDNRADVVYIKNQLKEAVKLAKKNGSAIAICHPREMTFKALMSCEGIFEGVDLVYIDELL